MGRSVAWVSPAEQGRRFAAKLARLDAEELEGLRARCATGEAVRNVAIMEARARRLARDAEDARVLARLRERTMSGEIEEGQRALDAQRRAG